MTPNEIVAAFANAHRLFLWLEHAQKTSRSPTVSFVIEARVRLQQLRYVLGRFVDLDHEHGWRDQQMQEMAALDPDGHNARARNVHSYGEILELYAEAFYLFAWRVQRVVQRVPGFKGFDAKGVRLVRNWLIEHAENESQGGVMARAFTYDCEQGLVLKPFGGSAKRVVDKGLYPNADEFISKLLPRAIAAVKKVPAAVED